MQCFVFFLTCANKKLKNIRNKSKITLLHVNRYTACKGPERGVMESDQAAGSLSLEGRPSACAVYTVWFQC